MRNSTNALRSIPKMDTFSGNETSIQSRLGHVKELTKALMDELKSLEAVGGVQPADSLDFNTEVRRFEVELICRALRRTAGHQTRAAQLLGIKLTTLHDKMKRYNIDPRNLEDSRGN